MNYIKKATDGKPLISCNAQTGQIVFENSILLCVFFDCFILSLLKVQFMSAFSFLCYVKKVTDNQDFHQTCSDVVLIWCLYVTLLICLLENRLIKF